MDKVKMQYEVGQRISREVTFDEESIREFARLAGDENPLHHDKELAARTRFRGLIASGTHSAAIMMSPLTAFTVQFGSVLGLEFSVKFRKPVRAGEHLHIEWEISEIEEKPSLEGSIVSFTGQVINNKGETVVSGFMKCLIMKSSGSLS